jgi:hypothetical protein
LVAAVAVAFGRIFLELADDVRGALDAELVDVLDEARMNTEPVVREAEEDNAALHHAARRDFSRGGTAGDADAREGCGQGGRQDTSVVS